MSKRSWIALLVLGIGFAFVGGDTLAGKGGKGGGKKPPEPPPPGTIYFSSTAANPGTGLFSMDAAGNNITFVIPEGVGRQSYDLHNGQRWFLLSREHEDILADGSFRRELVAKTEGGTEVLLWTEPGTRVAKRRWAKDDSFLSFKFIRPGDGTSGIRRGDVDWSTGAPVLVATVVVLEGTLPFVDGLGRVRSNIGAFDWSPDGTQLAYEEKLDFLQRSLLVKDFVAGVTRNLGKSRWDPQWAREGSRIAFSTGGVAFSPSQGELRQGIYTVKPDGSDLFQVFTPFQDTRIYRHFGTAGFFDTRFPTWSPDSSHLVFRQVLGEKNRGTSTWKFEILRIPATGGSPVNLTKDIGETENNWVRPKGWR